MGARSSSRDGSFQKLLPAERAIATENKEMLLRRWKLAVSGVDLDAHTMGRWFPGQKGLLELLSVLSMDEVLSIAECKVPLFRVKLPLLLEPTEIQIPPSSSDIEEDSRNECYLALLTRADAIQRSKEQAEVRYGFTARHANFLTKHTPRELQWLLGDLAVAVEPAVSQEFFVMAGMTNLPQKARTVFAVASWARS